HLVQGTERPAPEALRLPSDQDREEAACVGRVEQLGSASSHRARSCRAPLPEVRHLPPTSNQERGSCVRPRMRLAPLLARDAKKPSPILGSLRLPDTAIRAP